MALTVIKEITLDMSSPSIGVVYAKQGDSSGRVVRALLTNNGEAWSVPSDAYAVIRYRKSDNIGGFYDMDEYGNSAISYVTRSDRTKVDIVLSFQALSKEGTVYMELNFYTTPGVKLSTFRWNVIVEKGVLSDDEILSGGYYNILTEQINTAVESARQASTFVGAPFVVTSPNSMTDKSRVYVYAGSSTSSYTNGHWYFWNGSKWASGGPYSYDWQLIEVSDTQPTDEANRVWFKKTQSTIIIPTMNDLDDLKNAFEATLESAPIDGWERGSIAAASGTSLSSTIRCRLMTGVSLSNGIFSVIAAEGYKLIIYAYLISDDSYVGSLRDTGFVAATGALQYSEFNLTAWPETYYYKFVALREDGATMALTEADNILFYRRALDATLTSEILPPQSKAVGDAIAAEASAREATDSVLESELDDVKSALFTENTFVSADLTALSRSINPSNKWTTLSGATTGYIEIPSNAEKIVITPKSGVTNVWAFLNSIGTPTTGETPDFSVSYPGRITGSTSTPRTYSVEPDMHFIYFIQINTSGVNVFPTSVSISTIKLIDDTLSISGKAADAKVTGDRFASVEDALDKFFETSAHDFSGDEQLAWTILRTDNTWFAGGASRSYVINAGGAVSVDIQASAAGNCVFAVLKSFHPVSEDPVDYAGDTTAVLIQAGNSYHAEIPADAGYLYFSALSSAGVDVTPTVQITTKSAGGNVYNYYNTNTATNNVTQNTYNVTPTPELSAETLYYLQPTGDATDRSADIAALLAANGICRLGSGTYYVTNIDMPNGSAIEGVGASTVLRFIGNATGYALRMRSRCKVRNLRILGDESYTALKPAAATPGDRIGILWEGILNGDGNTYTYPGLSMISGVWFERIQGSGLKCLNTSSGTRNKLLVSDCYYLYCDAGANIASLSEFMQFANCTFNSCYYGVINNGGNNTFANCDFAVCAQCFVIDNSTGALENPGHSCMVNCDFSHAIKVNSDGTLTSNQGDFISLAGAGYEFNGCQFGFGHINLTDAEGVLCVGCVWSGRSDNDIYITNGTGIFFVGCLFGAQYSFNVVNNTKTKLINCYTKAGEEVLL